MWNVVFAYILAFALVTLADAGSTLLAMASGAGQEFNPVLSDQQKELDLEMFAYVNGGLLAFSAGMLAWALINRSRIEPRYIERPYLAAASIFYLNPFSESTIGRSPLHYIALAPAIVIFKAIIALNNTLISLNIPDLLTPLAVLFVRQFGDLAGYVAVITVLLIPIWLVSLYIAARTVRQMDGREHFVLATDGA